MRKTKLLIISSAAVAALALTGTAVAGAASAQGNGASSSRSSAEAHKHGPEAGGPIGSLVSSGVFTESELEAALDKIHTAMHEQRAVLAQEALAGLVADGTLSQEQADKALTVLAEAPESRPSENGKEMQGPGRGPGPQRGDGQERPTQEGKENAGQTGERPQGDKGPHGGPAGRGERPVFDFLTAEQADAVANALRPAGGREEAFTAATSSLVASGDLTQAQADALIAAHGERPEAGKRAS